MSSPKTAGELNKQSRATTWSPMFTEIGCQASYSKLALDVSAGVSDGRPRHSATKADHNRDSRAAHRQPCTTAIFDNGALAYTTSVSLQ